MIQMVPRIQHNEFGSMAVFCVAPYVEIGVQFIDVTPELAERWLSMNNEGNRNLRQGHAASLASDMQNGRWWVTHEGIAFDDDGILRDGQHRLSAVVRSGATVRMMAVWGIPETACAVINTGKSRSAVDGAHFAGYDIDRQSISIVRGMIRGITGKTPTLTNQELWATFEKYRDSIDFVRAEFPVAVRAVSVSPLQAVVARAYYHADSDQLRRFVSIVTRGDYPADSIILPGDRTAMRLHSYLKDNIQFMRASEGMGRCYRICQNALRNFLDGNDVKAMRDSTTDFFPLVNANVMVPSPA